MDRKSVIQTWLGRPFQKQTTRYVLVIGNLNGSIIWRAVIQILTVVFPNLLRYEDPFAKVTILADLREDENMF